MRHSSKKFHGDSTDENKRDNNNLHSEKGSNETPIISNDIVNIINDEVQKPSIGKKFAHKIALCTNPISKVEEPEQSPHIGRKTANRVLENPYV